MGDPNSVFVNPLLNHYASSTLYDYSNRSSTKSTSSTPSEKKKSSEEVSPQQVVSNGREFKFQPSNQSSTKSYPEIQTARTTYTINDIKNRFKLPIRKTTLHEKMQNLLINAGFEIVKPK